ncbi:hypothetical protein ACIBEJ_45775 [Nonomuraea sp. NPDC050790]|uniref:hypothetical protein n=1 Tax=Nonomuraea sp. NPDC050790 TaxID=3364371 RepID=UPI003795F211
MNDGDYGLPGSLRCVLEEIAGERRAQDARWGIQDVPDGTSPVRAPAADEAKRETSAAFDDGTLTWRHILAEEVLEAFAESDTEALRTELIQVAAVAVKWVQAIDRRAVTAGTSPDPRATPATPPGTGRP